MQASFKNFEFRTEIGFSVACLILSVLFSNRYMCCEESHSCIIVFDGYITKHSKHIVIHGALNTGFF